MTELRLTHLGEFRIYSGAQEGCGQKWPMVDQPVLSLPGLYAELKHDHWTPEHVPPQVVAVGT